MKIRSLVTDFVDLVFPDLCPGCEQPFAKGEKFLCTSCEYDLPLFAIDDNILDRFIGRISLLDARAYFKFYTGGITQKLLHAVKYGGDKELGIYLGRMFMMSLKRKDVFAGIDVIVPVPLHPTKLRSRGYNQSAVLAFGIADALGLNVDEQSVVRLKKSETQTRKTRAERWHNVAGIFEVTGNKLRDKNVLLVDDVITTGATLEACGEAILAARATSLSFGALAAAM